MNSDVILITEKDLVRIKHLISTQASEEFEKLDYELERANVIGTEEVPSDLVTMNSKVRFLNVEENREMVVSIVYPSEANFSEGKISVLASLGSALIGLRVGQEIKWELPDGRERSLKILEVLDQP